MTAPPPPPDPLEQAKAARAHSRQGFLDAVDVGTEVRRLSDALLGHYHRNHIGEGLEAIWGRTKKGKT